MDLFQNTRQFLACIFAQSCYGGVAVSVQNRFPDDYDPSSLRAIVTPSAFARQNLFYVQEAGHIRLLKSHAGLQRSSLDSYLIVQVAAGSGVLHYGGRDYPLGAGQCFWVDCRRPHGYRSAPHDPWELRWVHFNGRSAPGFYQLFGDDCPVFTPADSAAVARHLDAVLRAAQRWDTPAELNASAEIAALLAEIVTHKARAADPGALTARRLDEVRDYLIEHCTEELTLDGVAAQFYISKYYLARSFKRRYGETIIGCVNSARLDAAKQLLRYTDLTLGEIAAQCGFKEQSYFTRRFKEAEGQTATAYRRAWRGK